MAVHYVRVVEDCAFVNSVVFSSIFSEMLTTAASVAVHVVYPSIFIKMLHVYFVMKLMLAAELAG
jgi:hypothetical protein